MEDGDVPAPTQESPSGATPKAAGAPKEQKTHAQCTGYVKTELWFYANKKVLTKAQKKELRTMNARARERMAALVDELEVTYMDWANEPQNKTLDCSFREQLTDNTST